MSEIIDAVDRRIAALLRTLVIAAHPPTTESTSDVPCLCWHCCHAFDGPRLQFPVTYDNRTGLFRVVGSFCSWECIRGYDRDSFARISSPKSSTIRYYYKKLTGRSDTIKSAPPRVALRAFGGNLTIDEFRAARDVRLSYELLDATRLVRVPPPQASFSASVGEPRRCETTVVDFAGTTSTTDNLRLKRPKPLTHAGRNSLERVLGLNSLMKNR